MPPLLRPAPHKPANSETGTARSDPSVEDGAQKELDVSALQSQSETLSRLHRQTTTRSVDHDAGLPEAHKNFKSFLRDRDPTGWYPEHRGVCFDKLTTYGIVNDEHGTKTLSTALWRTLTAKDIYEWMFKRFFTSRNSATHRAIISNMSGVVRGGEMVLVLGTPGSGCSTFLRTLGNQHSNFTKVEGFLSFSGLSSDEVTKSYRGEVAYVPEEDEHVPMLTVRQTLSFVLKSKVPQRYHDEIPDYLDMYGRVFSMSHVLDTPIGNDYIRGISGGERKRVSIMETLAVDAAVIAWDNSTRGLDAASAVKYAQSLRILTDVTNKATLVTLYQASDAILDVMDKIMVLDEGRMIYQGPVSEAQSYFERLGYYRHPRQTLADFLTSVTSPSQRQFRDGAQDQSPKGSEALEKVFRQSDQFESISKQIKAFQSEMCSSPQPISKGNGENPFKATSATRKSRYVPTSSSYNTTFALQVRLCVQREWSQLKQHLYPIYVRLAIVMIVAFLLGSMFYDMPQDSQGIYSRGGFTFYASIVIGWVQLAELEGAMEGRSIIARHKQQAIARPSVVGLSKVCFDVLIIFVESLVFGIIAYFLAGMRTEVSPIAGKS
jgi:ATP-binding cassette subfamily G (WHITE) protein 2 (SNQ2)